MWHSLRPAERLRRQRQTGPGDPGARRGLDHGDRRDAAQPRRRRDRPGIPRGRARQRSDFGDPAGLTTGLRTEIPAASAVARLADPERAGWARLVIPEGAQLDDTTDVKTNAATPGIFTMISPTPPASSWTATSTASRRTICARRPKRPRWHHFRCRRGPSQPANELGDDHRRIEGLIAPGTLNVDPSASAAGDPGSPDQRRAAEYYVKSGLLDTATAMNMSPYDILVVASLVQQEAKPQDFAEGGAGHLQPAGRAPQAGVRLDGELSAGPPRGGHHRRRPRAVHAVEHLRSRAARDARSVRPARRAQSGRASRRRRLAVLRDHRPAGHDAVHPRLSTASGEHRVGQAQRCPRQRRARGPAEGPAVLGSPIAHSRSPQLHLAAYRALGLDGWTYRAHRVRRRRIAWRGRRVRARNGLGCR